ncbi:MAG: hypothetical protein Q4E01_03980 [Actinomycetaceae bacterium]|nr:hypothetical protein [Actinomycetaceae bacterium]
MRKLLALGSAIALSLTLAACGGSDAEPETPDSDATVEATEAADQGSAEAQEPGAAPADWEPGLAALTEDAPQPEVESVEVPHPDPEGLEAIWEQKAKDWAEANGVSATFAEPMFQVFGDETIESYTLFFNKNGDWSAGDVIKVNFHCQAVEPVTFNVWTVADMEDETGQLAEINCGIEEPVTASWEYTVPADSDNLLFQQFQVPVEGFIIIETAP